MVTFSGVRSFLQQQSADSDLVETVTEFIEEFRRGACYTHPFDDGNHDVYFDHDEIKLTQLCVVKIYWKLDKPAYQVSVLCFDGQSYELVDVFYLLNHFLDYRQKGKQEPVDWVTLGPYVQKRPRWCGFLVGRDHEGPISTAIYSQPITPSQGLYVLNGALRYRFCSRSE